MLSLFSFWPFNAKSKSADACDVSLHKRFEKQFAQMQNKLELSNSSISILRSDIEKLRTKQNNENMAGNFELARNRLLAAQADLEKEQMVTKNLLLEYENLKLAREQRLEDFEKSMVKLEMRMQKAYKQLVNALKEERYTRRREVKQLHCFTDDLQKRNRLLLQRVNYLYKHLNLLEQKLEMALPKQQMNISRINEEETVEESKQDTEKVTAASSQSSVMTTATLQSAAVKPVNNKAVDRSANSDAVIYPQSILKTADSGSNSSLKSNKSVIFMDMPPGKKSVETAKKDDTGTKKSLSCAKTCKIPVQIPENSEQESDTEASEISSISKMQDLVETLATI